MIQAIRAPISFIAHYNHHHHRFIPLQLTWEGRSYPIKSLGLHHTYRTGRTLHHVFSVASDSLFFRLNFNTDNLQWTLEEIADDVTN